MPRTAYPSDNEIQTFFTSTGLTVPSGFVFTGYGEMASAEFERRTGRIPFLRNAGDVVRKFDPPGYVPPGRSYAGTRGGGRILYFAAGLCSLTSLVANGTTLTEDTDFRLLPKNAAAINKPYEGVEFFAQLFGAASSIVITGKWGYHQNIPEDAFQAMVRIGFLRAVQDIKEKLSLGVIRWKDDDVSEERSIELLAQAGETASEYVESVIEGYELKTVGLH